MMQATDKKYPSIVCTLGTTTDDPEVLKRMVEYGMDCARINTAYSTLEDYSHRISTLKSIADIPIMMDIKGPQIRLKSPKDMRVRNGDILMIGFHSGNVYFNKDFYDDVSVDDVILFENGTIKTSILKKNDETRKISLFVDNPGDGNFHKDMGVNVPGKNLNVELFSEKDLKVIDYAVRNGFEYIAQSFIRNADDVEQVYSAIETSKKKLSSKANFMDNPVGVIAKIENMEGVNNLESILLKGKSKDNFSVMIARGDLHVELESYKLPHYQKEMIKLCKKYSVPVIVATGFLESMNDKPHPSRAEISDAANAVLDGADTIMLSGETSNSQYPAEAVFELSKIIKEYGKNK